MGSEYEFSGYVINTGDAILTNVMVFSPQMCRDDVEEFTDGQQLVPFLGPIDLAPGQAEPYAGCLVPYNTCEATVIVTGQETCKGTWITNTTTCPVAVMPAITVTEDCQQGQVTNGSSVAFGGMVCNSGNITLTNVFVYSCQPSNIIYTIDEFDPQPTPTNTLVLGPITLYPGACETFSGSYIAIGGSNPATNCDIGINPTGDPDIYNCVISYTTTNVVIATGIDICQSRTVSAAADCLGPLVPTVLIINQPKVNSDGFYSLCFPTDGWKWYTVQYKDSLLDPAWTDLVPPGSVAGTGGPMTIIDPSPAALHPTRFYRIMSMP